MFVLAGRMLNGEDDNFRGPVVNSVIDQIWIPPRQQLAHALDLLLPSDMRKQSQTLQRFKNRGPHAKRGLWTVFVDIVGDFGEIPSRTRREAGASSLEATERGFDLGIGCELAALSLRQPFQHRGKVRGINLLWLSLMAAKGQHGERDFILTVRRQSPHGFQGFFQQFCHGGKIWPNSPKWKGVRQASDFA
jgi:hypothetical protein